MDQLKISCTSCEEEEFFTTWKDFFDHVSQVHYLQKEYVLTKPFNISNRTKKEIVDFAEKTYLKEIII